MNPFVQQLEDRKLLTATLDGGVLEVEGTRRNDNITVSLSADGQTITVSEAVRRSRGRTAATPTTAEFAVADVTSISINAGAGNDNVVFRALGDADFAMAAAILGGDGNDWIGAGAGADTVDGGAGDDAVRAGAGADSVTGGDGDDKLEGGAGADTLDGGLGNDVLKGGADADTLNGGEDDDTFYAARDGAVDVIDGGADTAGTDEDDQDLAGVDDGSGEDGVTDTVTNATVVDQLPGGGGRGGHHHGGRGGGGFGGFGTRRIR